MPGTKPCPVCEKTLEPIQQADGSECYECDCAGAKRTVIHVLPAAPPSVVPHPVTKLDPKKEKK